MTIPAIFYTVVSENDGFGNGPLCWEQDPLRATRQEAEALRSDCSPRHGRTWLVECRVLQPTMLEPHNAD